MLEMMTPKPAPKRNRLRIEIEVGVEIRAAVFEEFDICVKVILGINDDRLEWCRLYPLFFDVGID